MLARGQNLRESASRLSANLLRGRILASKSGRHVPALTLKDGDLITHLEQHQYLKWVPRYKNCDSIFIVSEVLASFVKGWFHFAPCLLTAKFGASNLTEYVVKACMGHNEVLDILPSRHYF